VRVIPLFGAGTKSKSAVVTSQRRLNVYFENRPDGDKSKVAIYGTPGLVASFKVSNLPAPMRGMAGDAKYLYVCFYNQLYVIVASNGVVMASNPTQVPVNTTSGNVSIQPSPTQVLFVDGAAAYLYSLTAAPGTGFSQVASFPATGARTVTFCSGFFVAEQPSTQTFWVSNAYDGSTWNALAFAEASSGEGTIQAVDQLNGVLILFMSNAMEFWQDVGTTPEPFAPIQSAYNDWGLAAIFSRAHINQGIAFLGLTTNGTAQLCFLNGFSVQVISDADTEAIWQGFSTVADAVALTYQVDHHPMYQISFPSANRSWIFDLSTGISSEVQTGPSVNPSRHWGNFSALAGGFNYISDYATNQIYQMNPNVYTDNGQVIIREIITRHVLSAFNRVRISLLYLDMETGVGLQTGQGSNPQIMLQVSRDNGRSWSAERWTTLGAVGKYLWRVSWRRFGIARDYVFRIRMSDPVKFVITEGAIKLSERQPAAKLG
jgi:hypothetical protein